MNSNPVRFKIRTWNRIFTILLFVAVAYLVFSIIPPTILSSIYIGIYLVIFSGGFCWYTSRLIRQGKGEERRP